MKTISKTIFTHKSRDKTTLKMAIHHLAQSEKVLYFIPIALRLNLLPLTQSSQCSNSIIKATQAARLQWTLPVRPISAQELKVSSKTQVISPPHNFRLISHSPRVLNTQQWLIKTSFQRTKSHTRWTLCTVLMRSQWSFPNKRAARSPRYLSRYLMLHLYKMIST